ncbi:MAG: hypothetical protein ACK4Z0_02980 [Sphingomonadaceae bacterium]
MDQASGMMVTLLSALGVLLMVALAWVLGFRSDPVLDEGAARAEAEARLAGFRAGDVALAKGGRGALVRGLDGSMALLLPLADGWVARRLEPGFVADVRDAAVEVALGEPGLRRARLALEAVPDWIGRPA